MRHWKSFCFALGGVALLAIPGFAQDAISAKAGMVNLADGDVFIGDRLYTPKGSEIASVAKGEVLRTSEGRAEVLLTPGSFLRMGEASSFRLVDNDLNNVTIEVLTGGVLVEVAELLDGNTIRLRTGVAMATLKKSGLYRVDVEPEAKIRVYDGEALVVADDREFTLKSSRELVASAAGWSTLKFDTKETDPLYRWSRRRSEYVAMANLSAARKGMGGTSRLRSGMGMMAGPGQWVYNPWMGTMTFLPVSGIMYSPFGYVFYSPATVFRAYYPRYSNTPSQNGYRNAGGGWDSGGFVRGPYGGGPLPGRSATASYGGGMPVGGSSSAPAAAAPSGGDAGGARSGGGAAGRGGSSGGGRGQ